MIKAKLSDGTLILGLSALNIAKLKEGMPILFDGRPVGLVGYVAILYGETEDDIMREIHNELHIGGTG